MPNLLLLAALVAGIVIGDNSSPFPPASLIIPLILALFCIFYRPRSEITIISLCAISLCVGILLYDLNRFPSPGSDSLLNYAGGDEVILDGRILATAARVPTGYTLDVESVHIAERSATVQVRGYLRLYVESGENIWSPGDNIRFSSKLRRPRPFGTPGEFDLGRQLALDQIFVTAFVPDSSEILLLRPALPAERSLIERGRNATARFITSQITSSHGPLVKALAIGDKNGLPPEILDLLARGGLSHLFAISGLHLALIAVALYLVGLSLYRRSTFLLLSAPPARLLPILIAPLLILYLLWTGTGVSTQRALLMVLTGTLLFLLRRKTDALNLLWFAALLILLYRPLALFTPSFQLSFAALAGILCGHRIWAPLIEGSSRPVRYLVNLLFSSLAATLSTLPLVIYHFHLIAPSGIVTNLFAIPVISWIAVPLALAGSLLWPSAPDLAVLFFKGCECILAGVLKITETIITLPGFSGWTLYPSLPFIAGISLLMIALFCQTKRALFRAILVAIALAVLLREGVLPETRLSITAFSVGQGESLLISLRGSHYLIDSGGLYGDRFDTGRQLVAPALGRLGVHRLDGAILTHSHPDHAKGFKGILSDIPCKELITGSSFATDDPLLSLTRNRNIPIRVVQPGWSLLFNKENLQLFVFSPSSSKPQDENDRSLAIYVRDGLQGALLTGDLGAKGIQELIRVPPPGPVTLLKLPHHGSQGSRPYPLIDLLRPQMAFVSVGYQNRFGFPHSPVVNYLEGLKIPLFRTDRDGTIHFSSETEGWQVDKLQSGFFIDTSIATLLKNNSNLPTEWSRPQ